MIKGVTISSKESSIVCRIDNFSDELKAEIRERLATVCHGPDAVAEDSVFSLYKNTLKEFNKRYRSKTEKTKKGMIGELLTHILIFQAHENLESANPFFNMEEASIKKGFDLIFFDKELNRIWVSEVKSGSAGKNSANSFNNGLINKAKNDLRSRLNENETNLWHNAINGAKIALSIGKVKDRINEILEDCYQEAADEEQDSTSKNVILISVTFKKYC